MLERARFQGSFQYYSECQDVEVKPVPLLDKWKKNLNGCTIESYVPLEWMKGFLEQMSNILCEILQAQEKTNVVR